MGASRRVVVSVAVAAAVVVGSAVGATALVTRGRAEPLPPIATTTFAPSTAAAGTELPFHVTSSGTCPAYSFDSPVDPAGSPTFIRLASSPQKPAVLSVACVRLDTSLDKFVDDLRRHPEQSFLVSDPVREHGPMGDAVRTQVRLSGELLTEWRVERDGVVVTVGYVHRADDESHTAQAEAMLASWSWG